MAFYGFSRDNYTPAATNGDIHVTAGSSGMDRIVDVLISGIATASAVNRQGLTRDTTNGITPTALTAVKMNPQSGAIVALGASTFTTVPVYAAQSAPMLALNAFGGIVRWVAAPGEEFYLIGAGGAGSQEGALTAKNFAAGGGVQNAHVIFEEM